jgi:hypothetical protein
MIKQTLTTNEAAHILLADENASWTYEGAMAITQYIEDLSEDMGEDIEFCRVAIRCDFSEYTANDLVAQCGYTIGRDLPSDDSWAANCEEIMSEIKEAVEERIVAELDNGNFIVRGC